MFESFGRPRELEYIWKKRKLVYGREIAEFEFSAL
jgi:hypothetical protein